MRGRHGTLPTRLWQHHVHLPPQLLVDARGIIEHAWRRGWCVQASPSVATDGASVAKAFFLPSTYVLHRRCKTPGIQHEP